MKPIRDKVVIRPSGAAEKTAGGLSLLPGTTKPCEGVVLMTGPGKPNDPMEVKVGATALYTAGAGEMVSIEGESLLFLREDQILATK